LEFGGESGKATIFAFPLVDDVDFVITILKTQLPYAPFVNAGRPFNDFFRKAGVHVVSAPTLRKITKELVFNSLDLMFKFTRGKFCHVTMDSTPLKDGRDVVDLTLYTFDDASSERPPQLVTVSLNLSLMTFAASTSACQKWLLEVASAWECRFALESELEASAGYPKMVNWEKECVIVSGTTDLGPGFYGAMVSLQPRMTAGCVVHGLNRILLSATKHAAVWAHVDKLVGVIGSMRKWKRTELKDADVRVPKSVHQVRWSTFAHLIDFAIENKAFLKKMYPAEVATIDFDLLAVFAALSGGLVYLIRVLQTIGPCDTLVAPVLIAQLCLDLIDNDHDGIVVKVGNSMEAKVYFAEFMRDVNDAVLQPSVDALRPVRNLIIGRMLRRFFGRAANTYLVAGDRTRKCNLLENPLVLASFALSPSVFSQFSCMKDIVFDAELVSLPQNAIGSLEELCNRFVAWGDVTIHRSAASVESETRQPGLRFSKWMKPTVALSGDDVRDARKATIVQELNAFVSDTTFQDNVTGWFRDFKETPEAREALLGIYLKRASEAPGTNRWIPSIIKILFSKPLTTVKSETNFSALQHLVTEGRLNMNATTMCGYFLACKSPNFVVKPFQRATKPLPDGQQSLDKLFKNSLRPARSTNAEGVAPIVPPAAVEDVIELSDVEEAAAPPSSIAMHGASDEARVADNEVLPRREASHLSGSTSAGQNHNAPVAASATATTRRSRRAPATSTRMAAYLQSIQGYVPRATSSSVRLEDIEPDSDYEEEMILRRKFEPESDSDDDDEMDRDVNNANVNGGGDVGGDIGGEIESASVSHGNTHEDVAHDNDDSSGDDGCNESDNGGNPTKA
jgi:hypothetical protein